MMRGKIRCGLALIGAVISSARSQSLATEFRLPGCLETSGDSFKTRSSSLTVTQNVAPEFCASDNAPY
jgi:hypothetical protein